MSLWRIFIPARVIRIYRGEAIQQGRTVVRSVPWVPTSINVIEKANSGVFSGTCLVDEEQPSLPYSPAILRVLV